MSGTGRAGVVVSAARPVIGEVTGVADLRRSVHVFVGSALAVTVAGAVALLTHQLWLFPSLGPAIMLHVEKPRAPESSPRNTLIGHAVALLVGYGFLAVCGLLDRPPAIQEGVRVARIVAVAGSLAVTALVLLTLKASHPPAGATTLIVGLGLLHTPAQLLVAAASVVLVTVVTWVYNRGTGPAMPVWSAAEREGARRG